MFIGNGPRSLLGTALPVRKDDMLNAGPRAWIAFAAGKSEIKFLHRLPVMQEACETKHVETKSSGGTLETPTKHLNFQ